jgi:hypothetical protein
MAQQSRGRLHWADVNVESDAELNDVSSSADDFSSSADVTSNSSGVEDPRPRVGKKKIKNLPLSRAALRQQLCKEDICDRELALLGTADFDSVSGDDIETSCSLHSVTTSSLQSTCETIEDASEMTSTSNRRDLVNTFSAGSALHEKGTCKPCLFVNTSVGCQNGAACDFCHLSHKRKSKPRPCKDKRERYRRLIARCSEDQQSISDTSSQSSVSVRKPSTVTAI